MFLEQFASKVDKILDGAEKQFYQLFQNIDNTRILTVTSQTIEHANIQQNQMTDCQNQSAGKKFNEMNSNSSLQKHTKKRKLGSLINKKQQLMNKLRVVDRQLLQCKLKHDFPIQQKSNKEKKFTLNLKQQNMKYQMLGPLNNLEKTSSSNRTLDIIDQFNRQKIRRHEEIISRMKIRQLDEIRKIQELEEKRIKIELKRNQSAFQVKENTISVVETKLMKKIR